MADIDTVQTFVDGQTVNAATLNNIMDQATILEAFISAKSSGTLGPTDLLVISQGGVLKKAAPGGIVSSVSLTMPSPFVVAGSPVTSAGTLAVTVPAQSGSVFFCSPVFGVSGAPLFRHIVAQDTVNAASAIAAFAIDWRLNNNFYKVLGANSTFTFGNGAEGQQINVVLQQGAGAYTVTWPTVKWRTGVAPVMTVTNGRYDIFHFYLQGGIYFGWAEQNFF